MRRTREERFEELFRETTVPCTRTGWSPARSPWTANDRVVGAAWARVVDPVLARDDKGRALPEAIISVVEDRRGTGIGRLLVEGLMDRVHVAGHAGLVVTVSERNPVAVRLYERVGFEHVGRTPTGLLTMVWSAPP